jgi:four helix bundle protein
VRERAIGACFPGILPGGHVAPNFDKLETYKLAVEYVALTRPLVLRLRKEDEIMADQLHRAVLSIVCNTAEGAGEFSPGEKRKFYRYALRSATETIGILDAAHAIGLTRDNEYQQARETGSRLVGKLTKLVIVTSDRIAANKKTKAK